MALIGTHQINLRIPQDSKLSAINFDPTIEFDEFNYSFEKKFGSDTWNLNVGKVLSESLKLINQSQNSNSRIRISNLKVTRFNKGVMQWSEHEVFIVFDFALIKNGQPFKDGSIEGFGVGSGTEFGILTYIPILGNINFDKGIEVAVSRGIESALIRLQKEVKN